MQAGGNIAFAAGRSEIAFVKLFRGDSSIALLLGDCLERMRDIPSGAVDFVCVDPPYGVTDCPWDSPLAWPEIWEELRRVCKTNAAIAVFSAQPFTTLLIYGNLKEFHYDIIWQKKRPTGFFNSHRMPMRAHETIAVFYRSPPTFHPQKVRGDLRPRAPKQTKRSAIYANGGRVESDNGNPNGDRFPHSVVFMPNDTYQNIHPSQKPVGMCEWLIKSFSDEGHLVLDFTCGSGTTLVAAANEKRNAIGIEMDAEFYAVAAGRLRREDIAFAEALAVQ